jgi:thiol:disulfide interchange protein DsbC
MKQRALFCGWMTAAVCLLATAAIAWGQSAEQSLKKNFPRIKADSVKPSSVKGIYEVVSGDRIFYYMPDSEILIVGDLVDKTGRSLTQERQGEMMAEKVKAVPLEKALKIGAGKNTVIEFTDPDCPYCRTASKFLDERTDMTRYVFFVPLPSHPKAEPKVKYIFCAEDREKAYHEAMTGKLDDMRFKPCDDPKAAALAKEHGEIGNRVGIRATPTFFVNGKMVRGANQQQLNQYLDEGPKN